jgi:hypothetical protein
MSSPKNVKEVQRLEGRIAALSRFLPQSGGKAAPFYKCLRKDNNFKWTSECEKAFQELKQTLATPPILAKPTPGLPLQLYFTVTDKAVGSVMVQGIGGVQKIIYFFSHALQGAEQRYQRIEKAALTILLSARRLKAYFQIFEVKIKTDLPLRQILQKPDLAGRMMGWSIELSEYGLVFEPRGPIKFQALADFMTELTLPRKEAARVTWILSVDGSSNSKGSGAGIIIERSTGTVIEQCLKFEFKASNNQAEYEALIAGLRLAIDLSV